MAESANIAQHLPLMAARQPGHPALKVPRGRTATGAIDYLTLSFLELNTEVDAWCDRLRRAGVRPGDRTLLMVKQGLPLIAAVFALFKLGAVPIVIDPGMGLKNFRRCVARSQPRVLVGIPLAHLISHLFSRAFASLQVRVAASGSLTSRLADARRPPPKTEPVTSRPTDPAAILFTSGSTGAPKGVCYEHGMFEAQVRLIRDHYGIQPGEVDLPMLPIFALFNPALGMTTVVPEIDPRRPAAVDPAKIVQAILQENVTNSFGSPALWSKIQRHCLAHRITLPTMRRVLCAGAPVPAPLWEKPERWLPKGTLHSPYGATEALPVSSISADEVDPATTRGACVGRPLPSIAVRIIDLRDGPVATLADTRTLPTGEIGEIIVRGPVVTHRYDALPDETTAAKIIDGDTIWHRMGDCGFFDHQGLLWFSGRKVERVDTSTGTLFTEPCEQVFRQHPLVPRCALVGLGAPGHQVPALVVESIVKNSSLAQNLAHELGRLARSQAHTASITTFFFYPKLPVDVRHNAKIHRLALAKWASVNQSYSSNTPR